MLRGAHVEFQSHRHTPDRRSSIPDESIHEQCHLRFLGKFDMFAGSDQNGGELLTIRSIACLVEVLVSMHLLQSIRVDLRDS
ncbi:MAG: hypothetical protein ACI8Z5_002268 [Lentimonas sp.]